ncbi:MAG: OsmC family protein [Spirochaetaceae bacterium]|nr:OsmC family protein [Spirochaetaceae bacterium]
MKHEIACAWTGGMAFEAEVNGHRVMMDADAEFGGADSGPRPKPLLLAALAGCSGMDVVSLLRKMREPLSWFDMRVEGELSEEHPKRYTEMTIVYRFKSADGLDPEKVEKAVALSQEKYCGVSATLRDSVRLAWRVEYL